MLFRSPEDQDRRTTQELIVLQLLVEGGVDARALRRVLIPLPNSYEELLIAANETFDYPVGTSLRLYTQELAGNKGWNVEITSSVWDAVKGILTSVIVEPKDASLQAKKTPRKSIMPPLPDRVVTHDAGSAPTKEVLDAARRLSRMSVAPGNAQRRASRRSFAPRTSLAPPPTNDEQVGAASEHQDAVKEETDDDEEIVFRSRSTSKRQVIASEDEDDEEDFEDSEEDSEANDMIDDEAIEDDLRDDGLEEEDAIEGVGEREDTFLSAKGSHTERASSQKPAPPPPKTPASKVARRTSEQRTSVSRTAPSPRVKKEREAHNSAAPGFKQEKPQDTVFRAPPRTQTQPEDRFVITIEYDDGTGEETETRFMTRGRHTVAKVLTQACRTFDIEDLYDRATLVLALELEEGSEIVEHRFVCPKEETMVGVGAEAESRFIVQIDDA